MAGDNTPTPDPTVLTTQQMERGLEALWERVVGKLETLGARLDAMDKAAELLSGAVNRQPTEIDKQIGHVREQMAAGFESVWRQFAGSDKALEAAFLAQKELGQVREMANKEAITKSEAATAKTIAGLTDQHADLKERVGRIENVKAGGKETVNGLYAIAGLVIAALSVAVAIIIATR